MAFIDTHTHIYLEQFDNDRDAVVERAISTNVEKLFLPNIDSTTIAPMLELCKKYPATCFPMMGLHPTSVKEDFENELSIIDNWLAKESFIAIGECGIDLYWDKTYFESQKKAFAHQIKLALKHQLPLVIHARESFQEIFNVLETEWQEGLTGVFHSFTGNEKDVERINQMDFYFGINGIVTFKNSDLANIVKHIDISKVILETDAPYLSPVPYRGKRNECSYLIGTAQKVAEIYNLTLDELGKMTTENANKLFEV